MNAEVRAIRLCLCGVVLPLITHGQVAARLHQAGLPPVQGELLRLEPPTNIVFRSDEGVRTNGFQALIFSPPEAEDAAPPPARVRLSDGSRIGGRLLSLDMETVELAPRHSPPLKLPRAEITRLRWTDPAQGVRHEGPTGTNKWVISDLPGRSGEPSWIFRDGLFLARGVGTVALDTGMSTVARVEFDLHWTDRPRFRANFFSRETAQLSFSEGYVFYSPGHGTIFAMTRSSDPRQGIDIRRVDIPSLVSSNYAWLDFRLNSQKGEGWLFADGRLVRHWTDLGISGAGQAVVFQNFSAETRLGIANLRVSDWDGRTSLDPPPQGNLTTIVFKNGDTVQADRPTVSGTNLTFRFNNEPLTVPVGRVAQIHPPPPPESGEGPPTWIHFVRGDWVRAELLGLEVEGLRWRRAGTSGSLVSHLDHIRGLHVGRFKPVMDLSWYFPKTAAPKPTE
jgi:hypothetical protein